jgi:hypothetical protein
MGQASDMESQKIVYVKMLLNDWFEVMFDWIGRRNNTWNSRNNHGKIILSYNRGKIGDNLRKDSAVNWASCFLASNLSARLNVSRSKSLVEMV